MAIAASARELVLYEISLDTGSCKVRYLCSKFQGNGPKFVICVVKFVMFVVNLCAPIVAIAASARGLVLYEISLDTRSCKVAISSNSIL